MTKINADGTVTGTPKNISVYQVDDEFVVSYKSVWLDGVYATVEDAVRAAKDEAAQW